MNVHNVKSSDMMFNKEEKINGIKLHWEIFWPEVIMKSSMSKTVTE